MTSDRIQSLHASDWQGVFYVTGGGSGLLQQLLTTAGASATVLEATIPYSVPALASLIGRVESSVDGRVAGALGMEGFARALALAPDFAPDLGDRGIDARSERLFGFGLSAALSTKRERRGEDRAHMSVQTHDATHKLAVTLSKDAHRQAQEAQVSDLALAFLQQTLLGLESEWPRDATIAMQSVKASPDLAQLSFGERRTLCASAQSEPPKALLCGAFDPFHEGHQAMLDYARRHLGCDVALELSVANADKPALDYVEVERRLCALAGKGDVWLTRLPLFSQKAEAFEGITFVVGADTIVRIADARFYDNGMQREACLRRLVDTSARFLVFGRQMQGGFQTLDDLDLPPLLRDISEGVSQSDFRQDVSSTALRRDADTS